jgi:hypothetical protein
MYETKATEPAREVDAVAVEEVKPAIASRTQTTSAGKTVSAKDPETAKTDTTGNAIKVARRSEACGDVHGQSNVQ